MKKRFVEDLQSAALDIANACNKLTEIAQMREQFKNGEVAQLRLTIGETELAETILLSNGKSLFADDLFEMLEMPTRKLIDERVCDLQTILETESAE